MIHIVRRLPLAVQRVLLVIAIFALIAGIFLAIR